MSANKANIVYVFKTSIHTKKQMSRLKPYRDRLLPNKKWNVDLNDCDKMLRKESKHPVAEKNYT